MYNEYRTVANKVMLHTENFTWGSVILSKDDLKNVLVSIASEEANYISNRYTEEVERINSESIPDEQKESEIATFAEQLRQELLDKGYVFGKDIEVIIHE